MSGSLPMVDVAALLADGDASRAAREIARACREHGFFYVVNHGVPRSLLAELDEQSRAFFALPETEKNDIRMARGGRAWRGFFPVGAELTSGLPDQKEGIYFGSELPADHPKVAAGVPLHGANLFPALPGFRETVLAYLDALTALGHVLAAGLALSLELPANYFARYTADPLILFRIFHYPPLRGGAAGAQWSVGEHTDYGFLTILWQDDAGGLEVKTPEGWTPASPVDGALLCNIGDMLDRMTGGRYRSTPHRVRNGSDRGRLSFPFFFDPGFDARVRPIDPAASEADDWNSRWDGASVHAFRGTYGEYLLAKVARVFPDLSDEVLSEGQAHRADELSEG